MIKPARTRRCSISRAQVAEPKGPGKWEFKVGLGYKAPLCFQRKNREERKAEEREGGKGRERGYGCGSMWKVLTDSQHPGKGHACQT